MLGEAVRFPYSGGKGMWNIAVGVVLTLLGFLVVPLVLVVGYALRVMRAVAGGAETPPEWDEWGDLFVAGLRGLAVSLGYLLAPGLLVGASVTAFLLSVPGVPAGTVRPVAGVVALASLPLLLFAVYALPAALVNVAVTRRLGGAVAFRRLWNTIRTGDYAAAWLLAFVVSFVATVVSGIAALTIIGGVFAALIGFYALVVGSYLYARGIRESERGVRPAETPGPAGGPASK